MAIPTVSTNRYGDEIQGASPLDVNNTAISYVPTPSGNTANLNSVVTDPNGAVWVIDESGDAKKLSATAFKEQNRFYADPNGSDATGTGANENPFATAQAAVNALGQAQTAVLNEAPTEYGAVTMATPNTTITGASNGYAGLVRIASLTATAAGTSVRAEGLTVVGNVSHTGTAPLYLNNVTVNGNYASSSTGYTEIKDSRIQDGTISKTAAGTLFIRDSLIGNATFATPNSVIALRNVTIDAGDCVTIGAGVVYSLQDVNGCVNIDPAAVNAEQAAIAIGLTTTQAEAAVTAHFMHIRMYNVDLEANPTQIVTRDPLTGELEYSTLASINTGAPVTVGLNTPTGASTEGAIHLVTDDGTPTGTVLEQYIYDTDSGVWIEMQRNAQDTLKFASASPTAPGEWDGEEIFVTSNGNSTGAVLEQWIWDKQSTTWIQRPTPVAQLTTTSLTPKVYHSAFTNARADLDANVADLLQLSDGSRIHDGEVTWTGHGLTVGAWYYLSQTTPGGYTTVKPTSGLVQQLFFVEDANTIHIDIEEAWTVGGSSSVGQEFAKTVYFNATTPSTATIFDEANPPATNDNTLKADSSNIYIGSDNSTWTYDSVAAQYETYVIPTTTKVALSYSIPSRTLTANVASILTNLTLNHNNFPTAWNNTTGTFTAPTTGYYLVAGQLLSGGGIPLGGFFALDVLKNGVLDVRWFAQSQVASSNILTATGTRTVFLNAGNTLQFRGLCTATTSTNNLAAANYISISQV